MAVSSNLFRKHPRHGERGIVRSSWLPLQVYPYVGLTKKIHCSAGIGVTRIDDPASHISASAVKFVRVELDEVNRPGLQHVIDRLCLAIEPRGHRDGHILNEGASAEL